MCKWPFVPCHKRLQPLAIAFVPFPDCAVPSDFESVVLCLVDTTGSLGLSDATNEYIETRAKKNIPSIQELCLLERSNCSEAQGKGRKT